MDQKPKKKEKENFIYNNSNDYLPKIRKKPKKNTKKLPFFIQKNIKIFFCLGYNFLPIFFLKDQNIFPFFMLKIHSS